MADESMPTRLESGVAVVVEEEAVMVVVDYCNGVLLLHV
jgi:hypothetical protein